MQLNKVIPRANPVVTLQDAKAFLNLSGCEESLEDDLITALISAATDQVEHDTGRLLGEQTWDLWLDHWPHKRSYDKDTWWDGVREGALTSLYSPVRHIDIPLPPLVEVLYLKFYDTQDTENTVSPSIYRFDITDDRARLSLNFGQTWPMEILRPSQGVQLRFKAGYTTVPQSLITAIKMLLLHIYESRGGDTTTIPNTYYAIINSYKVHKL